MASDLIWLGDPGSDDPSLVGGKAAGLARYTRRFRVPLAFCLPPRPEGAFDLMALISAYRELGVRSGWGQSLPVAVRSSAVESVVSGTVTPDTFVVDKPSGEIVDRQIATKAKMTVPATVGVSTVGVPRMLQTLPCLEDEAVLEAAGLALAPEEDHGVPCDVECAWRGDVLHLLQCRPVTALTGTGRPAAENRRRG
jgi:phosphoenolpyruvate synthase/pyruvate phosphate dikinase